MIWVTEAKLLEGYKVWLRFNDGLEGVVDLETTLQGDSRPIFQALLNPDEFKRFRVDMDTVVWENGLDLAPEFLHDLLKNSLVSGLKPLRQR